MYSMQWGMDYVYEALPGAAIRYAAEKRNLASKLVTSTMKPEPKRSA